MSAALCLQVIVPPPPPHTPLPHTPSTPPPPSASGTIERSKDPDTKEYIGPNRVWPGGLNMCRTIGDPQAEQVHTAQRTARHMHHFPDAQVLTAASHTVPPLPPHTSIYSFITWRAPYSPASYTAPHAALLIKLPVAAPVAPVSPSPACAWRVFKSRQVIAVPEVRHVTLPTTGGRIIIASDGVWDHMQPKSMIHQVSKGGCFFGGGLWFCCWLAMGRGLGTGAGVQGSCSSQPWFVTC